MYISIVCAIITKLTPLKEVTTVIMDLHSNLMSILKMEIHAVDHHDRKLYTTGCLILCVKSNGGEYIASDWLSIVMKF